MRMPALFFAETRALGQAALRNVQRAAQCWQKVFVATCSEDIGAHGRDFEAHAVRDGHVGLIVSLDRDFNADDFLAMPEKLLDQLGQLFAERLMDFEVQGRDRNIVFHKFRDLFNGLSVRVSRSVRSASPALGSADFVLTRRSKTTLSSMEFGMRSARRRRKPLPLVATAVQPHILSSLQMRILFYSAKPYDRIFFEEANVATGHALQFVETRLNAQTSELAHGFDAVCVFVNDQLNENVLGKLSACGIK